MARVRTVPDRQEAPKECSGSRRNEDRSKEKSPEKKQNKNHDELKHLHDSLSTFFTPSGGGRRRVAPKKFGEEDETKEESSEEKPARSQDMKPLTIDTNCDDGDTSDAPVVSPARRICEKLMDSLSPYFSATSEKRTHRRPSRVDGFFFPGESGTVDSEEIGGASSGSVPKKMKSRKGEDLKKVVGTRKTQNSASAALFGSPVDDAARTSSDTDTASNRGTKKSTRLRVPKQEPADDSYLEISPPPAVDMSQRKKRKTTDVSSPNIREKENVNWETFLKNGEVPVDDEAIARSEKARKDAQAGIDEAIKKLVDKDDPRKEPHWPRSIVLGSKQMKTWYSSPFPQEFASNPVLHICEFCLKYKKTASAIEHHREKCTVRCPPGNEIYRHNKTSVFEVDGNISSEYCQNLCLIAKLFIDHKTLYYDVEPFLFYIVTKNDQYGNNIVGYFSKEKYNNQNWNLSCIVTLPCYQKSGFGRFLIDFSYLLSRKAGRLGTPERPLSNAGRVSYASYWKSAILEWIYANMEKLKKMSLQEIANGTGIALHDVVETLDNLEWFQRGPDGMELAVNWSTVEAHHKLTRSDRNRIWLIETSLKWTPVQYSPSKDFPVRSPVRLATPHRSPCTANVGSTPSGVSIAAVGSTIKKGSGTPKSFKKKAARRKLTLVNRKEHPPSSSDSLSSDDEVKPISKEPNDALFESPDSGSEKKKAENTGLIGRQTNNSASTSATFTRRANRGKGIYEDDDRSSASSLSSDDDKDTSYSLGGSKGKKGKPQKGKGLPPPRKRRPPAKKSGKSPGKVFPPNYGTVDTAAGESTSFPRCDSAASSATVPMRQDDPSTPGGGRTFDDVDEYRPALSSFCDQAPSTSTPTSHSLSRSRIARDHRSTSLSTPTRSPVRSPVTDSSISRPHTPLTRMSRCSTPITDSLIHHQQQQLIMNMGGIPDDEEISSRSRAASVESDRPPQLQAVSGASSDEAPPILPNESHNDTPPILTAAGGYNSDDDDAPPQLSPVVADTIDAEPDPDKPPMVPLTEEQRQLAAMDQPPRAPIKKIDEETMNSFDTSAQSIMEPSSSTSMLAQTPQNTYPGSLKQNTTPGSVPSSGQMPNHTTPEMQQSFMSPGLQPGSVSSVHGVPPNATIDQGWAPPAPLSNPATPLRHSAGPFGSPQGPVQIPGAVQPLRASIDAPTSSKRSGESSRSKRTQQQQQAHQLQQQQQQFAAVHQAQFPMQMNPLNPYMQSQYPGTYPTAPGTYGGFDPTAYPPGNTFWQNYTPNYTKTNGSTGMERADEQRVFLPNMMPPAAMMYPNYPNGVNGMMQNAYRNVYPNPAAFNNTPNQFPPSFPLNSFQCHPNQFFGYHK